MNVRVFMAMMLSGFSIMGFASQPMSVVKQLEDAVKMKYETDIVFDSGTVSRNSSQNKSLPRNKEEWSAWGLAASGKICRYIGVFEDSRLVDFWLDVYADASSDARLEKLRRESAIVVRRIKRDDSLASIVEKREKRRFLGAEDGIKRKIISKLKESGEIKSVRIDAILLQKSFCADTLPNCWRRISDRRYVAYALIDGVIPGKYLVYEKKWKNHKL